MQLIDGQDAVVADWLAVKFGAFLLQSPNVVWGVIDKAGVLRGAFVVTWRCDTTAELHVFGVRSKDTTCEMFRRVFDELGVWRLEVRTSKRNRAIKRAAPKYGFRFQGVERDYYGPGEDALVYFMRPTECRWIKPHFVDFQDPQGADGNGRWSGGRSAECADTL